MHAYEITWRHTDASTEARLGDCRPDKKWRLHSKSHLTRLLSESTRTVIQSHGILIEIAGAYKFVFGDCLKRSMTNDVSRVLYSPGQEILQEVFMRSSDVKIFRLNRGALCYAMSSND